MIKIFCNVCEKEPGEDFLLSGEIFETRIPFDALNPMQQKQFKKTPVHICEKCYDKHLSKHIKK